MRTRVAMLLGMTGVFLCAAPVKRAAAQRQNGTQRSTLAGVYSAEQAARGEELYAGMCKSCHTAVSHTGVAFQKSWNGHSLSELFDYISTKMPKNEPGSLAPEQYTDLLAYLLKLNQMPVGPAELQPDTAVLGTIKIETRPSTVAKPSR